MKKSLSFTFDPIELHTSNSRVLNSKGRQLHILFCDSASERILGNWKKLQIEFQVCFVIVVHRFSISARNIAHEKIEKRKILSFTYRKSQRLKTSRCTIHRFHLSHSILHVGCGAHCLLVLSECSLYSRVRVNTSCCGISYMVKAWT